MVVVTTALCADRASIAAPQDAPQVTSFARTLAAKFTSNLRRSVSPAPVAPMRLVEKVKPAPLVVCETASGVQSHFSPFQFRLPPPAR
jgi:hypothetical protein